jgi:alpha-beta hydrolase superfamily lysophospholipase
VLFGGFGSYIEELFPSQLYLRDAGFDAIAFDGPGQGAALEEDHLPITPEWEKPHSSTTCWSGRGSEAW